MSELALWTDVADRTRRRELLQEMAALRVAVWGDGKDLGRLLGEKAGPVSPEDAQAAIEKAERVAGMRMKETTLEEARRVRWKG